MAFDCGGLVKADAMVMASDGSGSARVVPLDSGEGTLTVKGSISPSPDEDVTLTAYSFEGDDMSMVVCEARVIEAHDDRVVLRVISAHDAGRVPASSFRYPDFDPLQPIEDPWRERLVSNVREVMGDDAASSLPDVGKGPYMPSECVAWTLEALEALEGRDGIAEALNRCGAQMPEGRLEELRRRYLEEGSIESLHEYWRQDFLVNVRGWFPDAPEGWMETIEREGWGSAGLLDDDGIVATKIPADLEGYFNAKDGRERRAAYCHCARVKAAILSGEPVPVTYCNCGAGFYRKNWEAVLGTRVDVDIVRSVMAGDDVCTFRIRVPSEERPSH